MRIIQSTNENELIIIIRIKIIIQIRFFKKMNYDCKEQYF